MELEGLIAVLHRGPVESGRLTGALLLAMRGGRGEYIRDLHIAMLPLVGPYALESCLDEAWRTACALNLPLSREVKMTVYSFLAHSRYKLSINVPTSDVPPAANAPTRWLELWARVDLLLEYSQRLEDALERLQGHERVPGIADQSVLLARLTALALHNVKGAFKSTYQDVPWEEMEYLLVMFIEAHTVLVTLAHAVATARSTAAHLRRFRERLEKCVLLHRAEVDPEETMKRLKKEPWAQRAVALAGVVDDLTELRQDFYRLRDWNSLKEINETLGVASEALRSLQDDAWAAWGWLALRWGLFVVGERLKYSWLSPNLSPRWAVLVETMAPGGIQRMMTSIRDHQEHGKEGTNAKTLALSEMNREQRDALAEELEKVKRGAKVALSEVQCDEEWSDETDLREKGRVNVAKDLKKFVELSIVNEVIEALKPAKSKARKEFEHLSFLSKKIYELDGRNVCHLDSMLSQALCAFASSYIPEALPRILRLLTFRSTEHLEYFLTDLDVVDPEQISTPLDKIQEALKAIHEAPAGPLLRGLGGLGALRELASRWHECDQVAPTAVPFSPALFGRQLRNYLNHLDEVFHAPLELAALQELFVRGVIPLERGGARPRLRGLRWSRAEAERLLRLVDLKSDMFRCAREGHLYWLQRLVESGGDVSARDCRDRTLLHAAAQGGQAHVVLWLLGLGTEAVDPLAKDWEGWTALHVAVTGAVAEALLAVWPDEREGQSNGVRTPLHTAALDGRAEVVAVLLRDLRYLNAEHRGMTPLHHAAFDGHDQVVRLLLRAGARYQAAGAHTPLVSAAAARTGSGPAVTELLLGASPCDEDCWTAAQVAGWSGHEQPCSLLMDELSARGRLEWGAQARELLLKAGSAGSSTIVLRLLDRWPSAVSEDLDGSGATVMEAAAAEGHADLVRTLISRGADPERRVAGGLNALDLAAWKGFADTIDVLVQHIPGGSLQAALGTALCCAARTGQLTAVTRVVHHGAHIDVLDTEGQTPLAEAARSGHTEVVRWLLQQGADPSLGTVPPVHRAAGRGRLDVLKVLVPPLHGGQDNAQDNLGGVGASALGQAVQACSGQDLQRILRRFVEHLRPLSSRYSREDRRRDQAEGRAREQVTLKREEEELVARVRLLQQVDSTGCTALHSAINVSALPVVEYLLDREEELLRRICNRHKSTGVPRLGGLTVYALNRFGYTSLQWGAGLFCSPSVAESLLKRMEDPLWLALGQRDLQEVRGMAVEALYLAARKADSGRLVRAVCGWLSRRGEGVLGGGGLQDTRRRAVAVLARGQDAEWRRVVELLHAHLAPPVVDRQDLQRCAALAMRGCLAERERGEMALQLLCEWLSDLSGDEDSMLVLTRMVREAQEICVERQDRELFGFFCRSLGDGREYGARDGGP